jgi:hypothetical protein
MQRDAPALFALVNPAIHPIFRERLPEAILRVRRHPNARTRGTSRCPSPSADITDVE